MQEKKIFAFCATQATWEQVVAILSQFTQVGSCGEDNTVLLPIATCHSTQTRRWVRYEGAEELAVCNDTGVEWDEYVLLPEEGTQEVEFTSTGSRSSIRARCSDYGWEVTLTLPRTGDVKDHRKGDDSPYFGAYAKSFAGVFGFPAVPTAQATPRVRKELPAGTPLGE